MRLILKRVIRRVAYSTLVGRNRATSSLEKGRFTREEVKRILAESWRNFEALAPSLPRERTVGSRMNVTLAGATVSIYEALLAAGIEKEEAIRLIADLGWTIYAKWGATALFIARLRTRDPAKRLRTCINLFLRFPFNPPGYVVEHLPADGAVAFNIRRCPVAEYFRSRDLPELCVGAWCNQDYALAEMWEGGLERRGTLASGAECCDFRFTSRALPSG
jgi:hypothetical protein